MNYYFEDAEQNLNSEEVIEEPVEKKDDGYVMKLPESEKIQEKIL